MGAETPSERLEWLLNEASPSDDDATWGAVANPRGPYWVRARSKSSESGPGHSQPDLPMPTDFARCSTQLRCPQFASRRSAEHADSSCDSNRP